MRARRLELNRCKPECLPSDLNTEGICSKCESAWYPEPEPMKICPTCGGGVWPGRQSTDCPHAFHGAPAPRGTLLHRESSKPYRVYTEVTRALSEWTVAAENLRATSTELARLDRNYRMAKHNTPGYGAPDPKDHEEAAQNAADALTDCRRIERELMKKLAELVAGRTFTGLPR